MCRRLQVVGGDSLEISKLSSINPTRQATTQPPPPDTKTIGYTNTETGSSSNLSPIPPKGENSFILEMK